MSVASPVRFVWEEGTRLFILPFDACTLETHSFASTVTQHPVESGSEISDHVTLNPPTITLEGVYSNTPLFQLTDLLGSDPMEFLAGDVTEFGSDLFDTNRAAGLFQQLRRLRDEKIPLLFLLTSLGQFDSYVVTNLTVPRDAARGSSVFASVELTHVEIVNTETVAAGTSTRGKRSANAADSSQATKGAAFTA